MPGYKSDVWLGMGNILDLRRLRYFAAIAEHGSLSAAARALNVAQPALSHHVARLEASLGTPLLVRRSNGISLTGAGETLLRHAIDIGARVERAEADLRALAGKAGAPARLRLVVISSIAADLTPVLLTALAREPRDVVLRITESGTLDGRDLLEAGKADLAISLASKHGRPLAWERLHLVERAAGGGAGPVPLAEAVRQPLILPARHNPLRELLEAAALSVGATLNVVLEIDGPAPRLNAILAGHGSTIFGAHSIAGAARAPGLSIRPIGDPAMVRPLFLEARRGLDPALARRVRDVLAKAIASLGSFEAVDEGQAESPEAGHSSPR
ncbi:MAG TPA: LysR family transcriptional regulator [Sphingomonas sp.]